jgi:hypothetical protein
MIGEDTSKHIANLIWIHDFNTTKLIRIAATPLGSETTSPYWYTIGEWSYMMFVVQHPFDVGSVHMTATEDWNKNWASHVEKNPAGE